MQFALISTEIIPAITAALSVRHEQKETADRAHTQELAAKGIQVMFSIEVPNLKHIESYLNEPGELSLNKFGLPIPPTDGQTQYKLVAEEIRRRLVNEIAAIQADDRTKYDVLGKSIAEAPSMECPHLITFIVKGEQYEVAAWGEDHARQQLKVQTHLSHLHPDDYAYIASWIPYAKGVIYKGKAPVEYGEEEDVEVLLDQDKVRAAAANGQLDLGPLFALVTSDVQTRIRVQVGEWDPDEFWLVEDLLLVRPKTVAAEATATTAPDNEIPF
jgi:hypothetical protein